MNRQHSIDYAEFDTTFVGSLGPVPQDDVDRFVQQELMRVVEDVFDEVEHNAGEKLPALHMERLEIDLGVMFFADMRAQMPQRLRRELLQALDHARVDAQALYDVRGEEPLFRFFRQGYLPPEEIAQGELDALLLRVLDSQAEKLRAFFEGSSAREEMLRRLDAQFSPALAARARQLIEAGTVAEGMPTPDRVSTIPASSQLLAALEQDPAGFALQWQALLREAPARLAKLLREIGRRSVNRQLLARRLPAAAFAELVHLVEPQAAETLLSLLRRWQWLGSAEIPADEESGGVRMREWFIGYLLVERSNRFDAGEFGQSLLGQIAATAAARRAGFWRATIDRLEAAAQDGGTLGELAQTLLAQIESIADIEAQNAALATDYRRYARLVASLSSAAAIPGQTGLIVDIDALAQRAPWLLMRLLRELQSGSIDYRQAAAGLSAAVLEQLVYRFATLIGQTVGDGFAARGSELECAIRRHAGEALDSRAFFVGILQPMIRGKAIDFEALVAEENMDAEQDGSAGIAVSDEVKFADDEYAGAIPAAGARAAQFLLAAELLTTAAMTTGLGFPVARLQALKRRFLESQVADVGAVFDPAYFVERYVAALVAELTPHDPRDFYSRLGQALLRNSLPPTRDLAQRLIEQLDVIAGETEPAGPAQTGDIQADEKRVHDIAPGESIRVGNAGLALLAPWLPRLFEQLGFLEDRSFKDRATAERAVHCLQFLVDGSSASPEYLLVLNKILCGIRPGKPIRRGIELTAAEVEQLEGLLVALTQHWKALENTSIDGLRETFLQRGGGLERRDDAWRLTVDPGPFDVLLDQLPWAYSMIKFGWMDRVIYVDWR